MAGTVLLIEPYYAGSHKVLMDTIHEELQSMENVNVVLMTLPGKKWHWRARTSALYFAQNIPSLTNLRCIFTSCVLPMHELMGLRPDLQSCKKIVYFHENQLVYPVRKSKDRDFQYGYNQIMTCLAADVILFNSRFNQDSFLSSLTQFFKLQPDFRPKNLRERIEPKCKVMYFPLKFDSFPDNHSPENKDGILRIAWPHRWEHDKNPELFFRVLFRLKEEGKSNFRVNILGENFTDNPPIFEEAKVKLADHIDNFGFLPEKAQYFKALQESDIVLSTANHEFFGVAMLEAVHYQCFPLAPNNLVYPEIFSYPKCLFSSEEDLFNILAQFFDNIEMFHKEKRSFFESFSFQKYLWSNLRTDYINCIFN